MTPLDIADYSQLPLLARSDAGWQFEIYHPHCDRPELQIIELILTCTRPTLGDAYARTSGLAQDLVELGYLAGPVDGDAPGVGWLPYSATSLGNRPIRAIDAPMLPSCPPHIDLPDGHEPAQDLVVQLPMTATRDIVCEEGWILTVAISATAYDLSCSEVRVIVPTPNLDEATDEFGRFLGQLVAAELLVEPLSDLPITMSLTREPLGRTVGPDGAEIVLR